MQALLELDCIPSGMELFPAADEDQWTLIKKVIEDCDYYIVIIGGRYGSVGPSGTSFTRMEYEHAISTGKPTIAFLHDDPGKIVTENSEPTDAGKAKLEEFRELTKRKTVKFWKTSADLGSVVSRSLVKLMKNHPATGWVRSDQLIEGVAAGEILRLRNEVARLEAALNESSAHPPPGAEELAQGRESYEVWFSGAFETDRRSFTWTTPIRMSWDEIARVVLPLAAVKAANDNIADAIREHASDRIQEAVKKLHAGADEITASIDGNSLRTVTIQLRALGLIERAELGRWTLTSLGDKTMTRMYAVKKKKRSGSG